MRPKYHIYGVGAKAVRKMPQLKVACEGANIRPCSGPLLGEFPKYDPAEVLPKYVPTAYRKQASGDVHLCEAVRSFEFTMRDRVHQGQKLALSNHEMQTWSQKGHIKELSRLTYK